MKIFRSPAFIVILILSALALTGYLLRKRFIKEMLPQVEEVIVDKISIIEDSAYVRVLVLVKNRSWTDYELYHSDITIMNDTMQLVHYTNDSTLTLDEDQVKAFPIFFAIPVRKTIDRIMDLQEVDSTKIIVHGTIDFSTMFGRNQREFQKDISVEVPIPPKVRLGQITYLGEIRKGERLYDFKMLLNVVNQNKKEFRFTDVSYKLDAGKQIQSFGRLPDVRIPPMDSINIEVPFRLKVENEVGLFLKILFNNDMVDYHISIKGTVTSVIGLHQDIPTSFSTSGRIELYDPSRKKIRIVMANKKRK